MGAREGQADVGGLWWLAGAPHLNLLPWGEEAGGVPSLSPSHEGREV